MEPLGHNGAGIGETLLYTDQLCPVLLREELLYEGSHRATSALFFSIL